MKEDIYRNALMKIKASDKKINETYEALCNYNKEPAYPKPYKYKRATAAIIVACSCIAIVFIILLKLSDNHNIFKPNLTNSPILNTNKTDMVTPIPTQYATPSVSPSPSDSTPTVTATPVVNNTPTVTATPVVPKDAPVFLGFKGIATDKLLMNENNDDISKANLTVTKTLFLPSKTGLCIELLLKNTNNYKIKKIVIYDSAISGNIVFGENIYTAFWDGVKFNDYLNENIAEVSLCVDGTDSVATRILTIKEITYIKDDNTEIKADLRKSFSTTVDIKHQRDQYFEYTSYPDGTYCLCKLLTSNFPDTLILTSEKDGHPITRLLVNFNNTNLKNLVIPSSYISLPDPLLTNCDNLQSVKVMSIPMSSSYLACLLNGEIYERWNASQNESSSDNFVTFITSKQTYDMFNDAIKPVRETLYTDNAEYLHEIGLLNTPEAIKRFKEISLEIVLLKDNALPDFTELLPSDKQDIARNLFEDISGILYNQIYGNKTEIYNIAREWVLLTNATKLVTE